MDKMMVVAGPAPPPAKFRGPMTPAPASPMTLREMYNPRHEVMRHPKWREQLLDREVHRRNTQTDVAEMVIALDEGQLTDMLAFSVDKQTLCYVSGDSGVWSAVNGTDHHEVYDGLVTLAGRIDVTVIRETKELIRRLRAACLADSGSSSTGSGGNAQDAAMDAEEHLRDVVVLYERLRTPGFQQGVVKRLITMRVMATKELGLTPESMDVERNCIAFTDGVYCFQRERLLSASAARQLYQTQTVQYRFDEMKGQVDPPSRPEDDEDSKDEDEEAHSAMPKRVCEGEGWRAYDAFMRRIFSSTPEVRGYLMDLLASSALNENRQVIVFHHNVQGANGKSTLFVLIKRAFGELFVKCSSALLSAATSSSPSGPNEELVSTRGKRIVLFSEPSSKVKLSASFIKELTGGDEQSTRANYGKKQTFVLNGMVHVLCNKIPEVDDIDGGMSRRLRCIPYGSSFVDDASQEDVGTHIYAKQDVAEMFGEWKHYMMHEVMTAAAARIAARREGRREVVVAPDVVMVATRRLIERENTVAGFAAAWLDRTGSQKDYVTLKASYVAYCVYCTGEKKTADLKSDFKDELLAMLGGFSAPSGAKKNYWRGWVLKSPPTDEEEEEEEDDDGIEPARP